MSEQEPKVERRPRKRDGLGQGGSGTADLGPLLPDRAVEDDPERWGDREAADADDDHIRREIPPHHVG